MRTEDELEQSDRETALAWSLVFCLVILLALWLATAKGWIR